MILCSCTVLTDREIAETIAQLFARDPYQIITPGMVYHALGRRVVCAGCMPLVVEHIGDVVERHHRDLEETSRRKEEPNEG